MPTPPLELNQQDFAALCGVTRKTIGLWMVEGLPGVSKPSRNSVYIDLLAAIPWVRDTKWADADDKSRLARIRADDAQLDIDLKLGKLMAVADAEATWTAACSAMRSRLLSIPATTAVLIGPGRSQVEIEGIVRGAVNEALEALSGRTDGDLEEDDGAQALLCLINP